MQGQGTLIPSGAPPPPVVPDEYAGLAELVAASAFVKPYWSRLYALRQELHQLRLRTSAWPPALAQVGFDALRHRADLLLYSLEAEAPPDDPAGKITTLHEAIAGFIFSCSGE